MRPSSHALILGLILFPFSSLQAGFVTWDGGGAGSNFATPGNWVGDVAPATEVDSPVFDTSVNNSTAVLTSNFTIGSGQSMTTVGDYVFRMGSGGNLTLATGGVLDFASGGNSILAENPGGSGQRFTIEAGASAQAWRYFNDNDFTTEFVADAAGVTTFDVTNLLVVRPGDLEVDLSNYDISNGNSLVLFDYASINNGLGGYNLVLTPGWTATLDYAFDIGGGDFGVALTNISAVPEPSSFSLIAVSAFGLCFRRRRKIQNA